MGRPRKPKSESGFYEVDLTRPFEHLGFVYRPGTHLVDEALLGTMKSEEGLVEDDRPAD